MCKGCTAADINDADCTDTGLSFSVMLWASPAGAFYKKYVKFIAFVQLMWPFKLRILSCG